MVSDADGEGGGRIGSGGEPVRVLLVDDEALMRTGLRLMIDGAHGIEVIGEAADGQAALDQARALEPDVVLMDIRMPRMTGLEALRVLRAEDSPARVVMLTAFDTDEFLLQALRAGAVSFLLKDSPPEDVVQAVLEAAEDRPRFSPDVLSRLVRLASHEGSASRAGDEADQSGRDGLGGAAPPAAPGADGSPEGATSGAAPPPDTSAAASPPDTSAAAPPPDGITEREWDVARLVAQGLANPEIGEQLFMSVATVKTHLGRLYHKLQVTNRVQLAIRVLELGG
ncbi:response regulator [Brachybacterium sp. GCM10030268]|uniref:response regulator n=1 Tax=Brachybacterium sp. GCM10030268 TaxID=3273382 RepID=UPI003608D311